MVRTWGPTATTSAQVRRFETWAVAGMRMPALDLRSPSDSGICTRTRSDSIWMGCFRSESRVGPRSRSATGGTVPSPGTMIEPLTLSTADGLTLEAELSVPDEPWAGAVLTHPHPV